ncbi:putative F-box domain-containing protein [Helianthus annuus]|nr:putative F-box domain-containing protein [Helianthus annuus]KAJ0711359.1 putative F-box domain-containing protein [Helianthus annuus]
MAEEYLPEHMLYHILLRMPTKLVIRFKYLSKQWNRLISDPSFMESRARRMNFLPSLPFHVIDDNVTGNDDMAPSTIKLFSPLINSKKYTKITVVGSFNGIVLLVLENHKTSNAWYNHYDHDMMLYNPLSGEFKTLPHSGTFDGYCNYVYGFGYSTTADDIKIVRLKEVSCHLESSEVFGLKNWSWSRPSKVGLESSEVFGLKNWSWSRRSKVKGYSTYGRYSGTFVNGFLYWVVKDRTCYIPLILALDINTMVFSDIKVPDGRWLNRLGTYNGRLCMFCSKMNLEGYELRVMNEHGFWSTICLFAPRPTTLISYSNNFGMLCILDDGKLLMSRSSKQPVIYDVFEDSYVQGGDWLNGF